MEKRSKREQNIAANVRRIRTDMGYSLERLSEDLTSVGYPMSLKTLSKLETGERGISVDDLMILAQILASSPEILMTSPTNAVHTEIVNAVHEWKLQYLHAIGLRNEAAEYEREANEVVAAVVGDDPERLDIVRSLLKNETHPRAQELLEYLEG